MAKTKISEFSATPANNTDIDSINLAEGCAPSGINDAIRELMAQLKDFQTGAAGDSFNGPVGTTTAAAGAFTNLTASGTLGVTGATTLSSALTYGGVTLSNAVTGTGNMVLSNSPTLVTPALGTPASGVVTNLTGTASININGTVGATTATTGAFTTLAASGAVTLSGGTANGVTYLNGSKVLTSGSALTFDGSTVRASGVMELGGTNLLYMSGKTGDHAYLVLGASNTAQDFLIGSDTNIPLIFRTNATEQMRLTSTGLGIGTSSPAAKLEVAGNTFVRSGNFYTNNFYAYDSDINISTNSSGSTVIKFSTGGAGAGIERMRLDSYGNLGLGVTPSAWSAITAMQVKGAALGSSGNELYLYSNAYYAAGTAWTYKASTAAFGYEQNGGHKWFTAPSGTAGNAISFTQAMTLDASGNLLVGVTSGSSKLIVQQSGTNDVIRTNLGTSGSANLVVGSGSTMTSMYMITSSGLAGQITNSGTVTVYGATSDYRLKTVIGTVTGAGERIDALEPVEYEWKADGSRTRGFLAHQFQEVYAGSVTGTKDAVDAEGKPVYQAMQASTSEVIADLVAEIQSLRQRLAAAGIA